MPEPRVRLHEQALVWIPQPKRAIFAARQHVLTSTQGRMAPVHSSAQHLNRISVYQCNSTPDANGDGPSLKPLRVTQSSTSERLDAPKCVSAQGGRRWLRLADRRGEGCIGSLCVVAQETGRVCRVSLSSPSRHVVHRLAARHSGRHPRFATVLKRQRALPVRLNRTASTGPSCPVSVACSSVGSTGPDRSAGPSIDIAAAVASGCREVWDTKMR